MLVLAKELKLQVTAEGIEHDPQVRAPHDLGIATGQGELLGADGRSLLTSRRFQGALQGRAECRDPRLGSSSRNGAHPQARSG